MKKNEVSAINALRTKVENLVKKSYSLNQAVKACQGIATEAELEALNLKSFSLANVVAAWSETLKVANSEGKPSLALYIAQPVTANVSDGKGEEKAVNVYERHEGKKGVTFRSLRQRVLTVPEKWTPSLVIEGLVQSAFAALAKQEADESKKYVDGVEARYMKVVKKDEQGFMTTTFEQL